MKEKPEKNGIEEDGHGLGHVIEKGDPGHVTSARDHVTENVAIEDEKFLEEELSRRHFVCCFLEQHFYCCNSIPCIFRPHHFEQV